MLQEYEAALQQDPGNLQALVRQGKVLHALKRTQVSTAGSCVPRMLGAASQMPMPPFSADAGPGVISGICAQHSAICARDVTGAIPAPQEANQLWEKAAAADLLDSDISLVLEAQALLSNPDGEAQAVAAAAAATAPAKAAAAAAPAVAAPEPAAAAPASSQPTASSATELQVSRLAIVSRSKLYSS